MIHTPFDRSPVLIVVCAMSMVSCGGSETQERSGSSSVTPAKNAESTNMVSVPELDADSLWANVVHQMSFGPRVPGTAGHRDCGQWLAQRLAEAGGAVETDAFEYRDPEGVTWPLENILGSFGPPGGQRLLLVAHWDTRPWSDMDPVPEQRDKPVPGANDGASGVAVLLEVARVMGSLTPAQGVDILFADGEDLGRRGSNDGFCQGTRRFAGRDLGKYSCAVVLDMVGDADLQLPIEQYSLARAPQVVDWVWKHGMKIAPGVFGLQVGPAVFDDHVPLLDAGLPAVDIIDFDYPAWHTQRDDLTAISRESLATVARVILSLVLDTAPKPGGGQ